MVAAGERFEAVDDVLLGHLGDDAAAPQATTERRQPIGQVEPANEFDDLVER